MSVIHMIILFILAEKPVTTGVLYHYHVLIVFNNKYHVTILL